MSYRVLIVDDSAVFRKLLRGAFENDPALQVVGEGKNGADAVELTLRLKPDVVTMDISMPVTDGIDAIRQIMRDSPRPIVVVSGTLESTEVNQAFEAMEAGALAAVRKPPAPDSPGFGAALDEIVTTVKLMCEVKVVKRRSFASQSPPSVLPSSAPTATTKAGLIAIAASTGGPAALEVILRDLPADLPVPVVIVQHIAAGFEQGLVDWLQGVSALPIHLASNYQPMRPGEVVISRSGQHLVVSRQAVMTREGDPVDGHAPSASMLFSSVAASWGPKGVGVILTGMGRDGTSGLIELKKKGGFVIGQDEATSVVYGMPGAAKHAGAVDQVLPLNRIGDAIVQACGVSSSR